MLHLVLFIIILNHVCIVICICIIIIEKERGEIIRDSIVEPTTCVVFCVCVCVCVCVRACVRVCVRVCV